MLLLAIAIPLLGSGLLFVLRPKRAWARNLILMSASLAASAAVALCVFTPGDHQLTLLRLTDTLTISFKLDGLGRVFGGLVGFLWPLASLYAIEYMRHEGGENHFFGFYLLSYGVTLGIAFSEDVMTMYIFYELLSLSTLPLVMHGLAARSVHAARKYAYYCLGGASMAFLALVTVISFSGNSNFVYGGVAAMKSAPPEVVLPMFVLGFFGFGVKAAVLPLGGWLPTASVAPTPVTALLHAVAVVKAGAFAVIRLCYYCFGADAIRGTWAQTLCLCAALATILYGSAMAVREQHAKRRLAYSTMSNLSYVLFGALLLTPQGLYGSLMHMVYHALMKIVLFDCVGMMMIQTGKSYIPDLRGLAKRMPFTCAAFLFCAVELVGIPPFIGFQSKWALAVAALDGGTALGIVGVGVLIVSAILTVIYVLTPALSMYALPLEPTAHLEERSYDPGLCVKITLGVLCAVMLALAFFSAPLSQALRAVAFGA